MFPIKLEQQFKNFTEARSKFFSFIIVGYTLLSLLLTEDEASLFQERLFLSSIHLKGIKNVPVLTLLICVYNLPFL